MAKLKKSDYARAINDVLKTDINFNRMATKDVKALAIALDKILAERESAVDKADKELGSAIARLREAVLEAGSEIVLNVGSRVMDRWDGPIMRYAKKRMGLDDD